MDRNETDRLDEDECLPPELVHIVALLRQTYLRYQPPPFAQDPTAIRLGLTPPPLFDLDD